MNTEYCEIIEVHVCVLVGMETDFQLKVFPVVRYSTPADICWFLF
jgi:hypothetical protein